MTTHDLFIFGGDHFLSISTQNLSCVQKFSAKICTEYARQHPIKKWQKKKKDQPDADGGILGNFF